MIVGESGRDLTRLVIPRVGRLVLAGDEGFRLLDAAGCAVEPVGAFFRELRASGRSAATLRSYGMDLLRWWRFLAAVDVAWDRAGRIEARDFSCWIQMTVKASGSGNRSPGRGLSGTVNPVTGKSSPGPGYATSTVVHSETVLRTFYDFHLETGAGPLVNPFPLARRVGRVNAHHNPMQAWSGQRVGRYRPRVPARVPRGVPDEMFDELFARLSCDRDRALLAFWISSGVRASELLGMRVRDVDAGRQLITVVRKGSRAVQQVPASPDAFVHLRLYQEAMRGLVPAGRDQPVWWTLRRPLRALAYHGAHRMFERVNAMLGSNWTLHDLRHAAARRMASDRDLPLTHVQAVMGHSQLSTTQRYLVPDRDEVIEQVMAHHARRARQSAKPAPPPAPGYDPASLAVLFGRPKPQG